MCDRRPIQQIRAFALEARTAAPSDIPEFENVYNYPGLMVSIDCTAVVSTPSVTFSIQTYDEIAQDWFTILTSAAVTGAGNTLIGTFMGGSATANVAASFHPGRRVRVLPAHGDSDSITYQATLHWVG